MLVELIVITKRLVDVTAEIRQLRFDFRAELATGGQYTAVSTITGEFNAISFTLSEMQRYQEHGPLVRPEPP